MNYEFASQLLRSSVSYSVMVRRRGGKVKRHLQIFLQHDDTVRSGKSSGQGVRKQLPDNIRVSVS